MSAHHTRPSLVPTMPHQALTHTHEGGAISCRVGDPDSRLGVDENSLFFP